jgi:tetratricopeptide (TPR) repeat protein
VSARDDALRRLKARLDWIESSGDLKQAWRDEALIEVADLMAATDASDDLEAANALGWLHWWRARSTDGQRSGAELATALGFLLPVLRRNPDMAPPEFKNNKELLSDSAVRISEPGAGRWTTHGIYLVRAYERTNYLPSLQRGVELLRQALQATSDDDSSRGARLTNLCAALRVMYERTAATPLLAEAVALGRDASRTMNADDPATPVVLYNLSVALDALASKSGDDSLHSEALAMARDAVRLSPPDDADLAERLSHLSGDLAAAGKQADDIDLLQEAVGTGRRAVKIARADDSRLPAYLSILGSALIDLAGRTGETDLIEEAVAAGKRAVSLTPRESVYLAQRLSGLGDALRELSHVTRQAEPGSSAVAVARLALDATPTDHPMLTTRLADLGDALVTLHELTGQRELLEEAASVYGDVLAADPGMSTNRLDLYGDVLMKLYEETESPEVLERAAEIRHRVIAETAADHPDRGARLTALGVALIREFEEGNHDEVLDEAVEVLRSAAALGDANPAVRAQRLGNVAQALTVQVESLGRADLLAEAVAAHRAAVAASPDDDDLHGAHLNNLGRILVSQLARDPGDDLAAEAVAICSAAVAAPVTSSQELTDRLVNLAGALLWAAERTTAPDAVAGAIAAYRSVMEAGPTGSRDRAARLNNLGEAVMRTAKRSGMRAALDAAVGLFREAEQLAPDNQVILSNLGQVLDELAARGGGTSLLMEATTLHRRAVRAAADDASRARALDLLSGNLGRQFDLTGREEALAEAVDIGRQAMRLRPASHRGRGAFGLANALREQAGLTGREDLLTEAVDIARQAVSAYEGETSDYVICLSNLTLTLWSLFTRTGRQEVLVEAVQIGRRAVAATSEVDSQRNLPLANLGLALWELYRHGRDEAVLDEAIATIRLAVEATPADHQDRSVALNGLGIVLISVYQQTGSLEALTESASAFRSAIEAATVWGDGVDSDRWRLVPWLYNLAVALRGLFDQTGEQEYLREADASLRRAASVNAGPARLRIMAYQAWAELPARDGVSALDVLRALESAVELLPRAIPGHLSRFDREHGVAQFTGLASQAAAAALSAGYPERAVELLEATRGMLVAENLEAHSSDLSALRAADAALAAEFEDLRDRLDALDRLVPGPPAVFAKATISDADATFASLDGQVVLSGQALSAARQEAHDQWDRLLERIRALGSMESFLRPRPIGELAALAAEGPVVFVTAHASRCDAMILGSHADHPVQVIGLPDVTLEEVSQQAEAFLQACTEAQDLGSTIRQREAAQARVRVTLGWLWDSIVGPVIAALGYSTPPEREGTWPRIWWCPVGIVASLPLHAAGHYSAPDDASAAPGTSALDCVISSYTATVRALASARAQEAARGQDGTSTTVIISEPSGEDVPYLASAAAEATDLAGRIPHAVLLAHPSRDDVLEALPKHACAHFACHGMADLNDPHNGSLILRDHLTAPLTVRHVAGLRLDHAELAFLSACQTTFTRLELADESVHITGAFQLAGYRHAVGTLWPVNDRAARQLAIDFYNFLTLASTAVPETAHSAHALHNAVRALRAKYPLVPTMWGAYIHAGI